MSIFKRIRLSFSIVHIDESITGNHDCDVNANCTNTVGGHNCSCKEGFAGDGRSCLGKLSIRVKLEQAALNENRLLHLLYSISLRTHSSWEVVWLTTLIDFKDAPAVVSKKKKKKKRLNENINICSTQFNRSLLYYMTEELLQYYLLRANTYRHYTKVRVYM